MAEKREVQCNGCGHIWSSGAKPKNLRCRKCGSKESFSIPDDVPDSQDKPRGIRITNRIKRRPTFLGDAVRDERDQEFLNKEIGKREYKGKLLRVTRIKEYVVSADGYWVTEFIIDLKG